MNGMQQRGMRPGDNLIMEPNTMYVVVNPVNMTECREVPPGYASAGIMGALPLVANRHRDLSTTSKIRVGLLSSASLKPNVVHLTLACNNRTLTVPKTCMEWPSGFFKYPSHYCLVIDSGGKMHIQSTEGWADQLADARPKHFYDPVPHISSDIDWACHMLKNGQSVRNLSWTNANDLTKVEELYSHLYNPTGWISGTTVIQPECGKEGSWTWALSKVNEGEVVMSEHGAFVLWKHDDQYLDQHGNVLTMFPDSLVGHQSWKIADKPLLPI